MRDFVWQRAGDRCEYCQLPQRFDSLPFHVDHIVAQVHGGNDEVNNLCWACTQCNLHKGTKCASIDSETKARVDLFNPRLDAWRDHFVVTSDGRIAGLMPTGRATVRLLDVNGSPQLNLRRVLMNSANIVSVNSSESCSVDGSALPITRLIVNSKKEVNPLNPKLN